MADWYVSSAAYAAIPVFQASHAYAVGDIIRSTTSTAGQLMPKRCTTAGTSTTEPGWATANNGTSTSGGATFTNVTGQSAYGWSAAAGDVATLCVSYGNRIQIGDRTFISSDHSEVQNAATIYTSNSGQGYSQMISVNRAG